MGLKDKILRRHPDPQVRYEEKERKRWEKKQKNYEKKEHKKKVKDTYEKAKQKAELQRARIEGKKAGLHKGSGVSGRIGSAMKTGASITDDMTRFMVGDDFNFGNFGMSPKKRKPASQPKTQYVIRGNKAYPVAKASTKPKKKPKKENRDPLWDWI